MEYLRTYGKLIKNSRDISFWKTHRGYFRNPNGIIRSMYVCIFFLFLKMVSSIIGVIDEEQMERKIFRYGRQVVFQPIGYQIVMHPLHWSALFLRFVPATKAPLLDAAGCIRVQQEQPHTHTHTNTNTHPSTNKARALKPLTSSHPTYNHTILFIRM